MNPVSAEEESFEFDVPEQGPQKSKYAFEPGKYRARCIDVEKGTTKPKEGQEQGDPKIVLTFLLLEGPGEGIDMKMHLPITSSAFWKVEQAAKALAVEYAKETRKIVFGKSHCVGRDVILDLKLGSFNGRERMEVQKVSACA